MSEERRELFGETDQQLKERQAKLRKLADYLNIDEILGEVALEELRQMNFDDSDTKSVNARAYLVAEGLIKD